MLGRAPQTQVLKVPAIADASAARIPIACAGVRTITFFAKTATGTPTLNFEYSLLRGTADATPANWLVVEVALPTGGAIDTTGIATVITPNVGDASFNYALPPVPFDNVTMTVTGDFTGLEVVVVLSYL